VIQGLKTDLARLEAELADASKVYTPKHPRVVALNTQIPPLRQRITLEINRIAQSIRNEYEVARSARESERGLEGQKRQVQELNSWQSPTARSARSREQRRIFDVLMSRRRKRTGQRMRTNNIRIVDRRRSPRTGEPRKVRNITLGSSSAWSAGIGLAFFLEYLDDTIRDPDDIERYAHVPFSARSR